MSLTGFFENVVKAKIESIFAITATLLVLFTVMMNPYISVVTAVTLLVALGIYEFGKRQKQEVF